tara:strand:+ start:10022 stop:10780 length:759 start_codon:yes stop_codon:yes gene_type:complete
MKLLIKKIYNHPNFVFLRNLLDFNPIKINTSHISSNLSVSDGFLWRTEKNFRTIFKFTDLYKLFFGELSKVKIVFYDKNFKQLKSLNFSDLNLYNNLTIDKNFMHGIEDYGTFYIFHETEKNIDSIIRNSCYTGYQKNNKIFSFVHGNLPTLVNTKNRKIQKNIIGKSLFFYKNYKIQKNFFNYDFSEIFLQNPTNSKIFFFLNNTKYSLNKYCSIILKIKKEKIINLKSKCFIFRPIVFSYKNNYIDVHHG